MLESAAASLTIGVFGIRWRIDLSALLPDHADTVEKLGRLWARTVVEPDGSELSFVVAMTPEAISVDKNAVRRGAVFRTAESFPYVLSRAITMASISVRRGSALILHAAGLVPPSRTEERSPALVLVGHSGAGKSTAVRELGRHWGYLSDETVVVESDLTISPYAKPISLSSTDRPHDKDEHSPNELGFGLAPKSCHVAAIVVLARDSNCPEPVLEALSLIDAMLEVLPQSSSTPMLPRPLDTLARVLTAGAGSYRLTYRQIGECSEMLRGLVDESGADRQFAEPENWVSHPASGADHLSGDVALAPAPTAKSPTISHTGHVRRTPWTDAIESRHSVLILRGAQPVLLGGIGADIWLAAQDGLSLTAFEPLLVARHGDHVDASDKIDAAIVELIQAGVLATY